MEELTDPAPAPVNARAAEAERRFAGPVVIAALASVPATFLTLLEGYPAAIGAAANTATLLVFTAEAVVLFALAEDRRTWIRRHRFLLLVTVATIPAVLFAIGPVQILRLLRTFGALRILRVRRILKATKLLRLRAGLNGAVARALTAAGAVVCALFVALVLADPTSSSRAVVAQGLQLFGPIPVLLAGAMLALGTFLVARNRPPR